MAQNKLQTCSTAHQIANDALIALRAARRKRHRYAARFIGRTSGTLFPRRVRIDVHVRLCTIDHRPSGGWVVRVSRDRLPHESYWFDGQVRQRRFPAPFSYDLAHRTIVRMVEQYVPTLDTACARADFYERCHKASVDTRPDIQVVVDEGRKLGHDSAYATMSLKDIAYWTGVLFPAAQGTKG